MLRIFHSMKGATKHSDGQNESSSSGLSSEVIFKKDIPPIKRRHSLVLPFPETWFKDNDNTIEIKEDSFDPYDRPSLRRSKSIACLSSSVRPNDIKRKRSFKSVHFENHEVEAKPKFSTDTILDLLENENMDTEVRNGSKLMSMGEISPQKSITSVYSDSSNHLPTLQFLSRKEYRAFENSPQRGYSELLNETDYDTSNDNINDEDEVIGKDILAEKNLSQQENTLAKYYHYNDSEKPQGEIIIPKKIFNEIYANIASINLMKSPISNDTSIQLSYLKMATGKISEVAAKNAHDLEKLEFENQQLHIKLNENSTFEHIANNIADLDLLENIVEKNIETIKGKIIELSDKLDSIYPRIVDLEKELKDLESNLSMKSESDKQLFGILNDFKIPYNVLPDAIRKILEENERLKIELKNSQCFKNEKVIDNLLFENNELKLINKELNQKVDSGMTSSVTRERNLNATISELRDSLYGKAKHTSQLEAKSRALESENITIKANLCKCIEQMEEADKQMKREIKTGNDMQIENSKLEAKCKKSEEWAIYCETKMNFQLDEFKGEIEVLESKILSLEMEKREKSEAIDKLERKLKGIQKEIKQANLLSEKTLKAYEICKESNEISIFNLKKLIGACSENLSTFLQPESKRKLTSMYSEIISCKVFSEENQKTLSQAIYFLQRSIYHLVQLFEANEQMLVEEIENRNVKYQNMLRKLTRVMEKRVRAMRQ